MEIQSYIARAREAQARYDERPGTQISLVLYGSPDNPLEFAPDDKDCDPGDCTDFRIGVATETDPGIVSIRKRRSIKGASNV